MRWRRRERAENERERARVHETSCENAHAVHLRHAMEVESVKGKRDVNGEETLTERSVTSSPPLRVDSLR